MNRDFTDKICAVGNSTRALVCIVVYIGFPLVSPVTRCIKLTGREVYQISHMQTPKRYIDRPRPINRRNGTVVNGGFIVQFGRIISVSIVRLGLVFGHVLVAWIWVCSIKSPTMIKMSHHRRPCHLHSTETGQNKS